MSASVLLGARELDNNRMRNEEFCNDLILEGRQISSGKPKKLKNEMIESAHRYVLFNMAIVERFLEMHMEYLRRTNKSLRKNPSLLWKRHAETFPTWLKQKICIDSVVNGSETLRFLAHGPKTHAMSYNGYIINGQRFHKKEAEKTRQNSGVSIEATTMCDQVQRILHKWLM